MRSFPRGQSESAPERFAPRIICPVSWHRAPSLHLGCYKVGDWRTDTNDRSTAESKIEAWPPLTGSLLTWSLTCIGRENARRSCGYHAKKGGRCLDLLSNDTRRHATKWLELGMALVEKNNEGVAVRGLGTNSRQLGKSTSITGDVDNW